MTGRFAPSPTGDFHLGNLRTGLIAWACARSAGEDFVLRMENLDERSKPEYAERQLEDLAAIGIDWDSILYQTDRCQAYEAVLDDLDQRGLLYECYCTRNDIRNAPSAPHQPPGAYPGTCRNLSEAEREAGRAKLAPMNRGPALRLATTGEEVCIHDELNGDVCGQVDDFAIRRGDGYLAYNLVACVDDGYQNITQVVRADDLLESTPRQVYLQRLLGLPTPTYIHVPLVLNPSGARLAKRDGDVTLGQLRARGWETGDVVQLITESLGMPARNANEFLEIFDLKKLPRKPWIFDPNKKVRLA